VHDKLAAAQPLLPPGLAWADVAAMGDDWPDLPLLARAGFACAPANAHAEARALAHHVTAAPRRRRRGARVLRPAADGRQRPLCRTACRPPGAAVATGQRGPSRPAIPLGDRPTYLSDEGLT
jgi:hypothetical protein